MTTPDTPGLHGPGPDCDPVGAVEIGQRLAVRAQTVAMWHHRSQHGRLPVAMPAPRWTVSGNPAWSWTEVRAWAAATRRLPADPT